MAVEGQVNNEQLLQMAINAAKRGQKDNARMMLRTVYTRDKRNETAILWMAKLAKNEKERLKWLERVLEINPDNQAAQTAIKRMKYKRAASENRMLLLFGAVAVIMIVITLAILVLVLT